MASYITLTRNPSWVSEVWASWCVTLGLAVTLTHNPRWVVTYLLIGWRHNDVMWDFPKWGLPFWFCQKGYYFSYFSFGFTRAYNSILFCCLRRSVMPCCQTHDLSWLCIVRERAWSLSRYRSTETVSQMTLSRVGLGGWIPAVYDQRLIVTTCEMVAVFYRRPCWQHLACCSVNSRYRLRIAISAYPTCIRRPR